MTAPAAPDRPTPDWLIAHAAFHHTLLDGCANRRLLAMANALREEAELYRRWSYPDPTAGPAPADPNLPDEHRELLDATLARDPDRAADALSRLINLTAGLRLHAEAQTRHT